MPRKQTMKAMKAAPSPTLKAALKFQKKIVADQVKRDRKFALQAAIDDGSLERPMKAIKAAPSGSAIAGIAAKIAKNAKEATPATPSGGANAAKIAVEGQITCKLQ